MENRVSWISGFFAFYLFTPAVSIQRSGSSGADGITWAVAAEYPGLHQPGRDPGPSFRPL